MRTMIAATMAAALAVGAVGCSVESLSSGGSSSDHESKDVLNLYTSRHRDADQELYKKFEEATGIKVNVVGGKNGELVDRLVKEKDKPGADVFLTVGAENIWKLNQAGVLDKSTNGTIEANIPAKYRGDNWMAFTSRARVIAYNKDSVDPTTITSYEDLTKAEWKDKVFARSSSNSYNQALLASFVSLWGQDKAKQWAQGVVDNFARDPEGNDRAQAKAVAEGQGDLAIMNSYYMALMTNSSDPEWVKVSEKIGLVFPEKTHVNIKFASVVKGAKNKDNAMKFLEFLSEAKTQEFIVAKSGEFPLNPKATMPELQKSWGTFTTQDLDFGTLGKYKADTDRIFTEVGWK